jgi:hypothetical protein
VRAGDLARITNLGGKAGGSGELGACLLESPGRQEDLAKATERSTLVVDRAETVKSTSFAGFIADPANRPPLADWSRSCFTGGFADRGSKITGQRCSCLKSVA